MIGSATSSPVSSAGCRVHPLAPAQLGLLYDVVSRPEDHLFVERLVCPLRGRVDWGAFQGVWQTLVERHAALRTGFAWDEERPRQVVHPGADLHVALVDWSGLPSAEQRARLAAFIEREGATGFDLARPPLMRLAAISLSQDDHVLVWTSHHLIVDGWSCWVLLSEAAVLYLAGTAGLSLPLPPTPSYADYARWVTDETNAPSHREYWARYFDGYRARALPDPRPGPRRFVHDRRELPATTAAALDARAREARVTLTTLLQAAWALALDERLGGDGDEVVFGTVFSGRSGGFPAADRLVGLTIGVLPVRVPLPPSMTVGAWIAHLHARHAAMVPHECCTLHQVQRWAGLDRARPVFDSVLVVMNVNPLSGIPGLGFEIGRPEYLANASYPLGVNVTPGAGTTVDMLYDTRYFTAAQIADVHADYATTLDLVGRGWAESVDAIRAALREARRRRETARRSRVRASLGRPAVAAPAREPLR